MVAMSPLLAGSSDRISAPAACGAGPASFALSPLSPALPGGLTLNPQTGAVSGRAPAWTDAASGDLELNVTLAVTNGAGTVHLPTGIVVTRDSVAWARDMGGDAQCIGTALAADPASAPDGLFALVAILDSSLNTRFGDFVLPSAFSYGVVRIDMSTGSSRLR